MTSALETVLINLNKMGFFAFLPFLLTAAVFYGLLRRSKLFGEPEKNVVVNAVVALVAAFMVWAYPIITGTTIEEYQQFFSTFFLKGTIITLTVVIGLIIAGMFFPEKGIGGTLEEKFKGKFGIGIVILGLLIGVGVLLASGATSFFGISLENISPDLIYSIIFLIIFIGVIGAVVWVTGKEAKK
jgi:drug/metabolite transporter (DMT)-like permease